MYLWLTGTQRPWWLLLVFQLAGTTMVVSRWVIIAISSFLDTCIRHLSHTVFRRVMNYGRSDDIVLIFFYVWYLK